MIVSGIVVFGSNGVMICRLLAWLEGAKFWELMRGTFLLTMTSDAAMLAIAPIFLITAKNNLLMLPLMGTATYFVYQTVQNALRRTHEANHDPLTQLFNRRAFNEAVGSYERMVRPSGERLVKLSGEASPKPLAEPELAPENLRLPAAS